MQNQQTIIITGGGQGIGKVSSKYLLTIGHKIIILEDDREAGMEAAEELNAVGDFTFIHCDITQEDQVLKAIEKVYRFHNGIDVLINNAAIAINKPMQDAHPSGME